MLNFNNIFRIAAAATASVALLVSCAGLELDQNDAVGYLAAPALDVDLTVDDLLLTKALDFDVEEPALSDVHFIVKDKNGTVRYDKDGLWSEPIVLPVGDYSIEASYGANGFGAPYFKGSASGSVAQLAQETPELTLELSNSLVRVTVDPTLEGHFIPGSEVSFNDGAHVAGYGEWTYVPSGSDLILTLAGTSAAGIPADFTHTLSAPSAKVAYDVVCGKSETNWPSISWTSTPLADGAFEDGLYFKAAVPSNMSDANAAAMKYQIKGGDYADWTDAAVSDVAGYKYLSDLTSGVDYTIRACVGNIFSNEQTFTPVSLSDCLEVDQVTAAHNNGNDASVQLTGTTMTIKGLKVDLPSVIAEMAVVTANGSFSSKNYGATGSFATIEITSAAKDISFSNALGWPYLPKGEKEYNATVTATCVINGTEYTASVSDNVTVPAPVFSVSASAYTSYDKRTTDLSFANNHANKYTVFERKASVSISDALLSNSNYASIRSSSITFNSTSIGSFDISSKDFGNDANCTEWKSYPFHAQMTFDGVTKEGSVACHITGLPYSANPPTDSDWSSSGTVNFRSGDVRFGNGGGAGSITFSKLHIPGNVNVSVSCKIDAYGAPINTTSYVEIGGDRIFECTSNSSAFSYKTVTLEDTRNGALSSSDNTVKAGTTYGLGTTRGHLYYIMINYR